MALTRGWGRTKPPAGLPVDLGRPRNDRLRLVVPFVEGGGSSLHAANPPGVLVAPNFDPIGPWVPNSRGNQMVYVSGDSALSIASTPHLYTPTGVTVVARVVLDVQTNFYGKTICFGDDEAWTLGTNEGGTTVATFRTWTAAGERTVSGGINIADGTFHTVIGTSTGAITSVYVDGKLQAQETDSLSTINTTTNFLTFGNSYNRNNPAPGYFEWFELHARAWSAQEVAEYESSPYDAIWRPRRWWFYRTAGAGGGLVTRDVAGSVPAQTGALGRVLGALRGLTGSWPAASGALSRKLQALRSLTGSWPAASGALSRIQAQTRSLAGSWPAASGALTRLLVVPRALAGSWPAASGALTRKLQALRSLAGDWPTATGALSRLIAVTRSLTGNWPAASGALTRKLQALRALTGNWPTATGTLAGELVGSGARNVAGNWPTATGALTRIYKALRSLAGDWPAASGTLSRIQARTRSLTGSWPAGSGVLTRAVVTVRSLTGSWPNGTGALTRLKQGVRGLTGDWPAQSATLARHYDGKRSLAGEQAAAVGAVTRLLAAHRTAAGSWPAATGGVAWSLPFGEFSGRVTIGDRLIGGAAVGDKATATLLIGDGPATNTS
jgi:hypothetical protein